MRLKDEPLQTKLEVSVDSYHVQIFALVFSWLSDVTFFSAHAFCGDNVHLSHKVSLATLKIIL